MLIGYARISTHDQDLQLQMDALNAVGCETIYQDTASGSIAERPGLAEALAYVRTGDALVVWRLDRLGRSLRHLIKVAADLETRGVGLQSLQESIDTTTPGGRLIFHVFGALAEFERALIRERTLAGLAAARARGKRGGRPENLDEAKRHLLYRLYDEKQHTLVEICNLIGISKTALYAYLRRRGLTTPPARS